MNTNFLYTILVALCMLLPVHYISAQVTIGSIIPPKSGALLDLKEFEGEIGGVTATSGLGLPRVLLIDNSSLAPTVSAEEAAQAGVAEMYAGLMLYNVGGRECSLHRYTAMQGLACLDWQKMDTNKTVSNT